MSIRVVGDLGRDRRWRRGTGRCSDRCERVLADHGRKSTSESDIGLVHTDVSGLWVDKEELLGAVVDILDCNGR
jgi:hypothetical protein